MTDRRRRSNQSEVTEASIEVVPRNLSIATPHAAQDGGEDESGVILDPNASDLTLSENFSSRVIAAATEGLRRVSSVTSFGSGRESLASPSGVGTNRQSSGLDDSDDDDDDGGGDDDESGDESGDDGGDGSRHSSMGEFSYGSVGGIAHTGPRRQRRASFSLKTFLSPDLDLIGEDSSADHGMGLDASATSGGGGMGGESSSRPPLSSRPAGRRKATVSVVARGRTSFARSSGGSTGSEDQQPAGGGGVGRGSGCAKTNRARKTIRSTMTINRRPARSSRPTGSHASANSSGSKGSSEGRMNTEAALATLGSAGGTDWQSVAAAAALVASEAEAAKSSSSKHHRRYGVGDHVLVSLSVLNATLGGGVFGTTEQPMADEEGEALASARIQSLKDSSTLVPVNKFGYPPGGAPLGSSHAEQRGPYGFVLATVARVHFDEDALYYTVTRADTGTDQRADAEWMEPVTSEDAYAAALFAAQTTKESVERRSRTKAGDRRTFADVGFWFRTVVWTRVVGWYGTARTFGKIQAATFLYGNAPYGCRLQFSGVNFLVLCGTVYMFIGQIRLAFFPASADFAIMVISSFVWSVLTIELLFEVLVRPSGFSELIVSEKAYAPSTARFINSFHLFFEVVALILFIPDFRCFATNDYGAAYNFSLVKASLNTVIGPTGKDSFRGYLYFAGTRFRIFNLVRHWKNMWINHTYDELAERSNGIKGYWVPEVNRAEESQRASHISIIKKENESVKSVNSDYYDKEAEEEKAAKERRRQARRDDKRLNKAATIGTALMVVNSHRVMILIVAIVSIFPLTYCVMSNGGTNVSSLNSVEVLQENNMLVPGNDTESCDYLNSTVSAWVASLIRVDVDDERYAGERADSFLLWAQVLPARCSFGKDGVITKCPVDGQNFCEEWTNTPADDVTSELFAEYLNLRTGVIKTYSFSKEIEIDGETILFNTTAIFNHDLSVSYVNFASFCLQIVLLAIVLLGLTVLRGDAGQLVLDPLRRMLKIVLRYAANPLTQTVTTRKQRSKSATDDDGTVDSDSDFEHAEKDQLGNYETEQLISAIAKITDLLRKCWGVAGADIISTNLARTTDGKTVVFNPTVAGKRVYALFGFAGINDFGHLLRSLDQDVMILINDIAKIVHEEVYRWGLGDSGQCNKNLGAAFLMVYRIGDFKAVQERKERATEVIFTSSEKQTKKSRAPKRRGKGKRSNRRAKELDTLQLASLPGIQAFTDRALLGMLKSFAGIYRDRALLKWTKDFRLGAGVDAFSLGLIFGMDAGWGVEGAVGSEYKIDATYLSPHVNMASRMMSACKQYGVSVLLSQAVEKLLSEQARSKLRHIDTVTVKGSTLKQQIFTYDAQHTGVDFFLFERSAQQADVDSDNYTPKIWDTDQDLKAMRQHISDDFEETFSEGRKAYLAGKWDIAVDYLREADRIMITTSIEEGYMEYESRGYASLLMRPESHNDDEEIVRLRSELGDGPCRCLISYMKKEGGVAPKNWRGVRPLTSK